MNLANRSEPDLPLESRTLRRSGFDNSPSSSYSLTSESSNLSHHCSCGSSKLVEWYCQIVIHLFVELEESTGDPISTWNIPMQQSGKYAGKYI